MTRPGRHSEGQKTRERVLDAAATLIATHGYAATSVARISKASGANPASIYWAFESKEGLFAAVMERSAASFYAALDAIRTEGVEPWDAIASLHPFFEEGPEFLRLLLVLSLERRDGNPAVLEAARRVRADAVERLSNLYEKTFDFESVASGQRISDELARHTLMLLDGVFVASQIDPGTTNVKRAFEFIATSVMATGDRLLADAAATEPSHGDDE